MKDFQLKFAELIKQIRVSNDFENFNSLTSDIRNI